MTTEDSLENLKAEYSEWSPEERASALVFYAESDGALDELRLLLSLGASVNHTIPSEDGETIEAGSKRLLKQGFTRAITTAAASRNSYERVKLLLEHGADANSTDGSGDSPLGWSAYYAQAETCKLLLAHGANVNHLNDKGLTPLGLAVKNLEYTAACAEVIPVLLAAGPDVDLAGPDADAPLHIACSLGLVDIAQLLLSAGADVNRGSTTPLYQAVKKENGSLITLLLEQGADPNKGDDGWTPWGFAFKYDNLDISKRFLALGSRPTPTEHEPSSRMTALLAASEK